MQALLTAFIAGVFFLIGALIVYFGKKQKGIVEFSIGMALSVMILLLLFDLLPEISEIIKNSHKAYIILFVLLGVFILKGIDLLIPHHDHKKEINHHERHLKHINSITSLAIIIHNIIEGMAIASITVVDFSAGLTMAIAVGLHNIPFGIEITATFDKLGKNSILKILILSISTLLGALIYTLIGNLNEVFEGILICITAGMILYIIVFELLPEFKESNKKKSSYFGLIIGIVLMIFNMIIGG